MIEHNQALKKKIEAWTKFTFPGRQGKYNDYQWNWKNFSGVDYDAREKIMRFLICK